MYLTITPIFALESNEDNTNNNTVRSPTYKRKDTLVRWLNKQHHQLGYTPLMVEWYDNEGKRTSCDSLP